MSLLGLENVIVYCLPPYDFLPTIDTVKSNGNQFICSTSVLSIQSCEDMDMYGLYMFAIRDSSSSLGILIDSLSLASAEYSMDIQ